MNPDFSEILSAFSAEGVEYLLVGAYAVAVHGLPRATGDLDLWVGTAGENPKRVRRALEAVRCAAGSADPEGSDPA